MAINATTPAPTSVASIDAIDQLIARKRRTIEGLLKMAVAVLPRAYDCGLFFNEGQTFNDAAWPFDAWIDRAEHSTALVLRAGRWEAVIDLHSDLHSEGDRMRQAERMDRIRELRTFRIRGRL